MKVIEDQMVKKIVIVGSGALATLYAIRFSDYFNVTMLGSWHEGISALNMKAILVESYSEVIAENIFATTNWLDSEKPDLVVWLTKGYKNSNALKEYLKLNWQIPILILQNGSGQKELFKSVLNADQNIYLGTTTQGAKLKGPGKVENTGNGNLILESNQFLKSFFQNTLPTIQFEEKIEKSILKKLAINAAINPTAAIFKVKNGEVVNGEAGMYLIKIAKEVFPYFLARGLFSEFSEYEDLLNKIAKATSENVNSMWADLDSGRGTEIDSILGVINKELKSDFLSEIIKQLTL